MAPEGTKKLYLFGKSRRKSVTVVAFAHATGSCEHCRVHRPAIHSPGWSERDFCVLRSENTEILPAFLLIKLKIRSCSDLCSWQTSDLDHHVTNLGEILLCVKFGPSRSFTDRSKTQRRVGFCSSLLDLLFSDGFAFR